MTFSISDHLPACRDLALLIAPELASQPLYIIDAPSALPRLSDRCLGFTVCGGVSGLLREHLRGRSEWEGPGTTVCLYGERIGSLVDLQQVVVHELGHCVPVVPPHTDYQPTDRELVCEYRMYSSLASANSDRPSSGPPWALDHGANFIRRALHLWFRAARNGIIVPQSAVCGGWELYSLPPSWLWFECLGNEPADMIDATFAEIEATPAPAEFVEHFEYYSSSWRDRAGLCVASSHKSES